MEEIFLSCKQVGLQLKSPITDTMKIFDLSAPTHSTKVAQKGQKSHLIVPIIVTENVFVVVDNKNNQEKRLLCSPAHYFANSVVLR